MDFKTIRNIIMRYCIDRDTAENIAQDILIALEEAGEDIDFDQFDPVKEKAAEMLSEFQFYGDFYYQMEDWLVMALKGDIRSLPLGIDSEYLKCALRVEVRDFFESLSCHYYGDEDVEEVVERLINHFSENVLNMDFIQNTVKSFLKEREGD